MLLLCEQIVEVGSVTCSSATPILSIDDYVDVKMAEVIQSCEIKYGKVEKGTRKSYACLTLMLLAKTVMF